jgi:predicted NAD/FAD-binding protein
MLTGEQRHWALRNQGPRVKIAIVGAGISGLSAAYLLSDAHDVTLFERDDVLGGHAHTISAKGENGDHLVDTGFLVFNELTYPHFITLLDRLGVASKESVMSFSYHDMNTGLEWKGSNLNAIFSQRRNLLRPKFWRMVLDILSFNRTLRDLLMSDISPEMTLNDVLAGRSWGKEFEEWYLLPMGAAIWSSNPQTFAEIPARTFAEFFSRHGLLNVRDMPVWRTIEGGSQEYVAKIEEHLSTRAVVRSASPVRFVSRGEGAVDVTTDEETHLFDHVIFACHSDQALMLLGDATATELEILSAIRYQTNDVTLHWDESLLPRSKRAWAAWNYRRENHSDDVATLTYNVSTLQSIDDPRQFLISLNSDHLIEPTKVLEQFAYSHPVLDQAAVAAQQRRHLLGGNRTSFCGAYFGYGFHEDGVRSALEVCESLGVSW